jgi:hypothetical protein
MPQNGAVPKSNPKSTTSAAYAQATWICLLASGRESNTRAPSVRHHEASWKIWWDGQFKASGQVTSGGRSGGERKLCVGVLRMLAWLLRYDHKKKKLEGGLLTLELDAICLKLLGGCSAPFCFSVPSICRCRELRIVGSIDWNYLTTPFFNW